METSNINHHMSSSNAQDPTFITTSLRSQLKSLKARVLELELENGELVTQLSKCQCGSVMSIRKSVPPVLCGDNVSEESIDGNKCRDAIKEVLGDGCFRDVTSTGAATRSSVGMIKKKSRKKLSDFNIMHHHAKRYVALKIMYFGQRFYGFGAEAHTDPTIESEIFNALKKTRLLISQKQEEWRYSRCGRTDKGVSSIGQVVCLYLRSNLKNYAVRADSEEVSSNNIDELSVEEEIDYVRTLNGVLPNDIRVISWCPAPVNFHARFSCVRREYKYLFWKENLDILAMAIAGNKFVGEHDFRNFCKMDAANVHNYRRNITSVEISSCNTRSEDDQLWALTIKGSSFLWHQVRCMVAVLFMIGRGFEAPTVIETLLDITVTPRKPQYNMASELPLVLQTCEFEDVSFSCSPVAEAALLQHLRSEIKTYNLQAAIFQEALISCSATINDGNPLSHGTKNAVHVPLVSRPTEPSYEERRAKLKPKS